MQLVFEALFDVKDGVFRLNFRRFIAINVRQLGGDRLGLLPGVHDARQRQLDGMPHRIGHQRIAAYRFFERKFSVFKRNMRVQRRLPLDSVRVCLGLCRVELRQIKRRVQGFLRSARMPRKPLGNAQRLKLRLRQQINLRKPVCRRRLRRLGKPQIFERIAADFRAVFRQRHARSGNPVHSRLDRA